MTLFFHFLFFWLSLCWVIQKIMPRLQRKDFLVCAIALAAVLFLQPISGLSLTHWMMSFIGTVSVPCVGLLLISFLEKIFSWKLFDSRDWNAAWFFGSGASFVLYPSALGLGRIDFYSWGWSSSLFLMVVGIVTFFLLCFKNRFGILLLLAFVALQMKLQGSTNLWDDLIDPFYGAVAVVMTLRIFLRNFTVVQRAGLDEKDKEQYSP